MLQTVFSDKTINPTFTCQDILNGTHESIHLSMKNVDQENRTVSYGRCTILYEFQKWKPTEVCCIISLVDSEV